MTEELKSRGFRCGRHRVATLMRTQGISVRPRKAFRPRTTKVDTTARIAPNHLAKACAPNAPHRDNSWYPIITYLRTKQGWLYLSIIVDLFSRAIVTWDLSDCLAAESVGKAIKKHRKTARCNRDVSFIRTADVSIPATTSEKHSAGGLSKV